MDEKHLISRYLEGELDPREASRFEESMEKDPDLRKEYDLYLEVNEAIKDTEVLDLRRQLDEIHEELSPQLEKLELRPSKKFIRFTLAATVAMILSLGTYSLFFKKVDDKQIVQQFYKPYDVTLVNRSANEDISPLMRDALYNYEKQNYAKAHLLFSKILETNPQMTASYLYSGISLIELKQYDEAEKAFLAVLNHNDNLYIEQADFYLGMVYMLKEEKDKARKILQRIKKSEGYYRDEASKMLRKMRANK